MNQMFGFHSREINRRELSKKRNESISTENLPLSLFYSSGLDRLRIQ